MNTEKPSSAEQKRELGKLYFYHNHRDREKRDYGLKLIMEAHSEGDAEATFIVACLILDGVLKPRTGDSEECALSLFRRSANCGCIQARARLNSYCEKRYHQQMEQNPSQPSHTGALVDFEGRPIRIDRQGVFTPVDAVLEYEDGRNVLTLSTNVVFVYDDALLYTEKFEQAVLDGLMAWQGDYEVFGGQKLSFRVNVTFDNKLFDNLVVVPINDRFAEVFRSTGKLIGTKKTREEWSQIFDHKRSFATSGLKWTVNSRKVIYLFSESGRFDEHEEIMHVTKHEFGHTLGLGDLYASPADALAGVEKGTYTELDGYAIDDRLYNLVMCDHYGPISNNDIEMVLLAFMENRAQLFQTGKIKGKISSALGKGN